jgi:hypothetical protein
MLAVAVSVLATGCAGYRYQSFYEGGFGEEVASRLRWEMALPYASGKDLTFEYILTDEVLLSDRRDGFHITKIFPNAPPQERPPLHLNVADGASCEILDATRLLVMGADDKKAKRVALVDRRTLSVLFSTELPFTKDSSFEARARRDISVPGWKRTAGALIVVRSTVNVDTYSWSDARYRYTVPYITGAQYDVHVLSLKDHGVRSFVGISSHSLGPLNGLLAGSSVEAMSKSRFRQGTSAAAEKSRPMDRFIFLLDQFFMVDRGRILVFSIKNFEGDRLYYSLDLTHADARAEWRRVSDLVAEFPKELAVSEPESADRLRDRDLKIGGLKYGIENATLIAGALVVVGRLRTGTDETTAENNLGPRILMRITPGDGDIWRPVWTKPLSHGEAIGNLLEDQERGVLYFPEITGNKYRVQGAAAADGKAVDGFPANFRIQVNASGKPTEVRIHSTGVDFERSLLYLHDQEKNRILCADLRRRSN